MKIRPALKTIFVSWTRGHEIGRDNNCSPKRFIADVWQGSEYASGSEYPRVLNSPGFWICLCGSEYARVLDIPEFWIFQDYTRFRICLNNSWICLNMLDFVWTCLNMPKYARIISLNGFCFTFSHFPIFLQFLFYLNTWLLIWASTGDLRL